MASMAGPGRPGRTHKGDRDLFIFRIARPVGDVICARSAAAGMSYSDYLAAMVARSEGMPQYAPQPHPVFDRGELPDAKDGDHDLFTFRIARPVGRVIRARSAAAGMSYSRYFAAMVARSEGMPQYAPQPHPVADQGELPIMKDGDRLKRSA